MTNFEHSPHILNQVESLRLFQDYPQVMISMKTDEQMQTASTYWGSIDRVVVEVPEPYVDIRAEKLVISYFTQSHRDESELFDTLRSAREAVTPSDDAPHALVNDMALRDSIYAALGVEDEHQEVALRGIQQRIVITGISMTMGIQSS